MFFASGVVVWYMYSELPEMEKVIGIDVPPLLLSVIKDGITFPKVLLNVILITLLVGIFTALFNGSVLVTVGEFTVKLVENPLNPLLVRS